MSMQIPFEIDLFGFEIQTFSIFLFLGLFFSFYAVWREGRKDGFDQERFFDSYIVVLLISIIFSRIFYGIGARFLFGPFLEHVFYFWRSGFGVDGFILGFIVGTWLVSRIYKWSLFRLSDIYTLALLLGMSMLFLGLFLLQENLDYLVFFGLALVSYGIFSMFRLKKLFSGSIFIIFLIFILLLSVFTDMVGSGNLLFDVFLITMVLLTSIWRIRKKMINKNLPPTFIAKIKDILIRKDKSLANQQRLLEEEDPYMQEGRTEGNADDVDEANLEDNRKNINDAQRNVVSKVSTAVKKALGKIERGEYGICDNCGESIDSARLEAYPETSLCTDCARRSEV